jgi:hypothetical protein
VDEELHVKTRERGYEESAAMSALVVRPFSSLS